MKKIGTLIVGIIIGVGLTLSPQIYGAGAKLLGKDVDNQLQVKLNDKVIGTAAVIEGTSYIPVRAFANEYQLDVAVDSKTITLTSPSAEENAKVAQAQQEASDKDTKVKTLTSQIELSKEKIATLIEATSGLEKTIASTLGQLNAAKANSQITKEILDRAQKNYDDAVQFLTDNKTALAAEQAILADLETQLAGLQQ